MEEGPDFAQAPPTSIYHTLDDSSAPRKSSSRPASGHYYHVLENPVEGEAPPRDHARSRGAEVTLPMDPGQGALTQKSLFDDPEYSPLKPLGKSIQVVDPRYTGDYERSPNYTIPRVQLSSHEVDPKYLGDYEWDPTYVPKPPPRRRKSVDERRLPPRPPERRQSLEIDPLAKYAGEYERDPSYVPPPLRNGKIGIESSELDPKYRGDYERDPQYMAGLVHKSSRRTEASGSAEYSYPYLASEDLVPPHIPHEYKALEDVLKDPPREYARLTSEPLDTTVVPSINTTV